MYRYSPLLTVVDCCDFVLLQCPRSTYVQQCVTPSCLESHLVARTGERIHSSNQEDKVIVKTAGRNDIAFSSSRFDAGRRRTRALPKQYKRLRMCSCGEIAYHLHRREVSSCSLALCAVSTGHLGHTGTGKRKTHDEARTWCARLPQKLPWSVCIWRANCCEHVRRGPLEDGFRLLVAAFATSPADGPPCPEGWILTFCFILALLDSARCEAHLSPRLA